MGKQCNLILPHATQIFNSKEMENLNIKSKRVFLSEDNKEEHLHHLGLDILKTGHKNHSSYRKTLKLDYIKMKNFLECEKASHSMGENVIHDLQRAHSQNIQNFYTLLRKKQPSTKRGKRLEQGFHKGGCPHSQ